MSIGHFDDYAGNYDSHLKKSTGFFRGPTSYFAEYKVRLVVRDYPGDASAHLSILDFGGGVGNSISHILSAFPNSTVTLGDVSDRSLEIAEARYPGRITTLNLSQGLDEVRGSMDLIFAAGVFHHIAESERISWLEQLNAALAPNGKLYVFEHNPLNPATVKSVKDCEFDEGVELIRMQKLVELFESAGLQEVKGKYTLFLPIASDGLRHFEYDFLSWLPVGAQYFVRGHSGQLEE